MLANPLIKHLTYLHLVPSIKAGMFKRRGYENVVTKYLTVKEFCLFFFYLVHALHNKYLLCTLLRNVCFRFLYRFWVLVRYAKITGNGRLVDMPELL